MFCCGIQARSGVAVLHPDELLVHGWLHLLNDTHDTHPLALALFHAHWSGKHRRFLSAMVVGICLWYLALCTATTAVCQGSS